MSWEIAAVFVMEALGCVFFGLWLGERKTRILMHNLQIYGTANVEKASVWMPSMDAPPSREVPEEEKAIEWADETIEKGVADLMKQSVEQGVPISHAEAREEVMLMLNSETGDML